MFNFVLWESPPPIVRTRTKKGRTQKFVDILITKPNTWAVYKKDAKAPYQPNISNTEWSSRKNEDGTFTIYGRYLSAE